MELSEFNELMQKGDYVQALELIKSLSPEEHLNGMILQSRILVRTGDFLEAKKIQEAWVQPSAKLIDQ